ncbi:zinc finger-like protein [Western grey kangaroopox virus]|uniref:Zinc finger-like protein n=1 Tax=Western grey kangaroopox virus TaxID=1566307 RepID=A0A2C9DSS4_9POXV|nr:zinc finger-like protein [Western grey kangaroopox virus]ATI21057.1 zinc finger-like protein [Western grey kangaroopox virus]
MESCGGASASRAAPGLSRAAPGLSRAAPGLSRAAPGLAVRSSVPLTKSMVDTRAGRTGRAPSQVIAALDDDAGAKPRRKRRKPRMTVEEQVSLDDACTTCSICQSKLVMFSDINRFNIRDLRVGRDGSSLLCAACGSNLCPLSELAKA